MKTLLNLFPGLAAAGLLGIIAAPAAAGRNLQMVVVAEQTGAMTAPALPTPEHPASYVAFDGGYIEAGDPIANLQPPVAATVAQALQAALAGRGYEPASGPTTPSVILIYHWGFIRRDSQAVRNGNKIDPNLHARLSLVSPDRQREDLEQDLVNSHLLGSGNAVTHGPGFLNFHQRDVLQLAHDSRYFVVVSAYDYAAASRQDPKLLWRAKMSAYDGGISMAEALPSLLQGGAPFLGRNLGDFEYVTTSLVSGGRGEPGVQRFAPPVGNPGSLDAGFLRGLMKQEHDEFSGVHPYDKTAYDPIVSAPPAGASAAKPVIQPKQTGTY